MTRHRAAGRVPFFPSRGLGPALPATHRASQDLPLAAILVAAVAFCTLGAVASLYLGQDANWDLKNYHLYNAWAALKGRGEIDVHPADLQSFFSPLLDLLAYPMVAGMPDRWGGAILGAIHGLPAFAVFLLAYRIFQPLGRAVPFALLAAVAGATSAMAISEIGTTFGDLSSSIPVVFALVPVARAYVEPAPHRLLARLGSAGLLIGIAVALKLSNAIFAIAFFLALLAFPPGPRWRALSAWLIGAGAGLLVLNGWWAWSLFSQYGNPVFPFANGVFRSPFYPSQSFTLHVYSPRTITEWIFYPFQFPFHNRTAEVPFRDFRIAAALVAAIAVGVDEVLRRVRRAHPDSTQARHRSACRFLLVFFLCAYVAWLVASSVQRFAIALDLIAPLICFLALPTLASHGWRIVLAGTIAAGLIFSTVPANWGRAAWDGNSFSKAWNVDPGLRGSAAILANMPLAFLAPTTDFAETAWVGMPFTTLDRERIESRIAGRRAFVVAFPGLDQSTRNSMARLGLGIVAPCSKIATKIAGYLLLCPAEKGGLYKPESFENKPEIWEFEANPVEPEVHATRGQALWTPIDLRNAGEVPVWGALYDTLRLTGHPVAAGGRGEVNVSYHLLGDNGEVMIFEGQRTSLPRSIQPGETLRIWIRILAPNTKGRYVIKPDVVVEGVRWMGASVRGRHGLLVVE